MVKKIIVSFFFLIISVLEINGQKEKVSFVVDTTSSSIAWFCGKHYGCIGLDTGYINVTDDKIANGKFVIDLNSLYDEDIDHELLRLTLANVIKSHEFFDSHRFPFATFILDDINKDENGDYNVFGKLTLKGKTLPISFKSEIDLEGDSISVYSDYFAIDRTNWGINYLSKKFDPEDKEQMHVPDEIKFLVQLKAHKNKNKSEKK